MSLKTFAYVVSFSASLSVLVFSLGLIGWGVTQPPGVDRYGHPDMNAAVGSGLILFIACGFAMILICSHIFNNNRDK